MKDEVYLRKLDEKGRLKRFIAVKKATKSGDGSHIVLHKEFTGKKLIIIYGWDMNKFSLILDKITERLVEEMKNE